MKKLYLVKFTYHVVLTEKNKVASVMEFDAFFAKDKTIAWEMCKDKHGHKENFTIEKVI